MSREVIVASWCDRCDALERKTAATHTYTVGIVKGENRPALRVVELCDEHDPMLADLFDLLAKNSIPLEPPKTTAVVKASANELECRVCGRVFTARGSIVTHVWAMHRGTPRPEQPARCPVCREEYPASSGMARHRQAHGWDSLDEAYEGLLS